MRPQVICSCNPSPRISYKSFSRQSVWQQACESLAYDRNRVLESNSSSSFFWGVILFMHTVCDNWGKLMAVRFFLGMTEGV